MRMSFSAAQIATKNLSFQVFPFGEVKNALLRVGIDVPTTQLDYKYRFVDEKTMHEIWEFMIHDLNFRKALWGMIFFGSLMVFVRF